MWDLIVSVPDHCLYFLPYFVTQPYMKSLPSYVKDTTHFICKIKSVPKSSKSSLLVILDVNLYTNIPQKNGIEACKYYLNREKSNSELSPNEICSLIKLTLENTHFQFNETNIQKLGTAMGNSMAPTYASVIMGQGDHVPGPFRVGPEKSHPAWKSVIIFQRPEFSKN